MARSRRSEGAGPLEEDVAEVVRDVGRAALDSLVTMQIHFLTAQIEILEGMTAAARSYLDALKAHAPSERGGEAARPAPPWKETVPVTRARTGDDPEAPTPEYRTMRGGARQ